MTITVLFGRSKIHDAAHDLLRAQGKYVIARNIDRFGAYADEPEITTAIWAMEVSRALSRRSRFRKWNYTDDPTLKYEDVKAQASVVLRLTDRPTYTYAIAMFKVINRHLHDYIRGRFVQHKATGELKKLAISEYKKMFVLGISTNLERQKTNEKIDIYNAFHDGPAYKSQEEDQGYISLNSHYQEYVFKMRKINAEGVLFENLFDTKMHELIDVQGIINNIPVIITYIHPALLHRLSVLDNLTRGNEEIIPDIVDALARGLRNHPTPVRDSKFKYEYLDGFPHKKTKRRGDDDFDTEDEDNGQDDDQESADGKSTQDKEDGDDTQPPKPPPKPTVETDDDDNDQVPPPVPTGDSDDDDDTDNPPTIPPRKTGETYGDWADRVQHRVDDLEEWLKKHQKKKKKEDKGKVPHSTKGGASLDREAEDWFKDQVGLTKQRFATVLPQVRRYRNAWMVDKTSFPESLNSARFKPPGNYSTGIQYRDLLDDDIIIKYGKSKNSVRMVLTFKEPGSLPVLTRVAKPRWNDWF
jgi:hypothetical protein